MLLKNSGQMKVVIVDVLGGNCAAFVKGTAHSCMEKQKMWPMYMKKSWTYQVHAREKILFLLIVALTMDLLQNHSMIVTSAAHTHTLSGNWKTYMLEMWAEMCTQCALIRQYPFNICWCFSFGNVCINSTESGFSGLGVACWPLVSKFAGSNPAEAVGFLRAKIILSTPSFGGEVAPSVPCRRFTACKRTLECMWKPAFLSKITGPVSCSQIVPPFAAWSSCVM